MEYIFLILEFAAAVFGTVFYYKYSNSNEKYFLYFLWFIVIVEFSNLLLKQAFDIEINLIHDVFSIVSFMFYFFWYYTILKRRNFKNVAIVFASVFIIVTILTNVFPAELGRQAYAFVTGAIGLLVLTVFHYYQLINSDEVLIVKHKLSFWISTALFLFYIGIVPLMLLSDYLGLEHLSFFIILVTLNVILYGCFIIGFIWTKKEYNRF